MNKSDASHNVTAQLGLYRFNEVIRVLTSHLGARPPFQSWGDQLAPVLLDVTDPRYTPPPNSPQTQDGKGQQSFSQNNDKF